MRSPSTGRWVTDVLAITASNAAVCSTVRVSVPTVSACRRQREDRIDRNEPERRLEPDDAAVGGRDPDRAAGVAAERVVAHACRDECGRAAARSARRSRLVLRVERHAVRRVHASGRVLEQVRLAEELGAGRPQPRNDGCVALSRRRDADGRGVRRHDAAHVDVVLDGDDDTVQRTGRRPLSGRQHRGHRVQPRLPLLATRVRGEQLEVRDLADSAAGLDLADELHRPSHERPVESGEDGLGLPPAHREIAVDARVGLRRPAVELDEALDRALEIGGVEAVERLRAGRRCAEHLFCDAEEEQTIARLREGVRDREIGYGRREQHRAVGLLRPEVAEDVVRRPRVADLPHEPIDPLARPAVDFADVEGAAARVVDAPRPQVVRAEVDECADRPLLPDGLGDERLVHPVL